MCISRLTGGLLLLLALAAPAATRAEEPGGIAPPEMLPESIEFLDVLLDVGRDGQVRVEQHFDLRVTGASIKRGPVLTYLTAFRGPGGLVLENGLEVEEVWRNDLPEPFRVVNGGGQLTLTCGARETFLEKGVQSYTIVLTHRSDWKHEKGFAMAAFDVLGPLQSFPIDRARVRLRLPDGVDLERRTEVVRTPLGRLVPTESSETRTELVVSAIEPLEAGSAFFVNAVWPIGGFAVRSQWGQVMTQHPRLPLAAFTGLILFAVLVLMIRRAGRRLREGPAAPANA